MSTIKVIAHLSEFTKDVPGDYFLLHEPLGTLHEEDVVSRMEKKEIATKNVNGIAFLRLFQQECTQAVTEGYNVVTPLFNASLGIRGTVTAKDLGHPISARQAQIHIRLTPGQSAREAVEGLTVAVAEQPAPVGPVIQSVTNPTVGQPDLLNAGGMALVQGLRIAVKGDRTDEIGLFFTSADSETSVHVPASQCSPNTPTKLQFVLPPAVVPGQWMLKIVTQASASSSVQTKEPRAFEYPNVVTVE